MILALGWLTISLPIVYNAQQYVTEISQPDGSNDSKSNNNFNPLLNTTEEKTPDQVQEYLHGQDDTLEVQTGNLDHLHAQECKFFPVFDKNLIYHNRITKRVRTHEKKIKKVEVVE